MTQAIEQLAAELGELLANSPMDEKLKKTILENIDTMPESLVFRLKDALENEKTEIDSVLYDIELFMKEQDERWEELEAKQRQAATEISDQLFEGLKDQPTNGNPGTTDSAA
jgi:hypothetical protein